MSHYEILYGTLQKLNHYCAEKIVLLIPSGNIQVRYDLFQYFLSSLFDLMCSNSNAVEYIVELLQNFSVNFKMFRNYLACTCLNDI